MTPYLLYLYRSEIAAAAIFGLVVAMIVALARWAIAGRTWTR